MKISDLASLLELPFEGEGGYEITGAAPVESAGQEDLSFATERVFTQARTSGAGCLIVSGAYVNSAGQNLIRADHPRAAFAAALLLLMPPPPVTPGIHPTAVIAPSARIDPSCEIGPHVTIGDHCVMGAGCRLYPNVTLYPGVEIGASVVLHAGCVLGSDGFGFVLQGDRYDKFPQVGRVRIGDHVEIGANSCVDRAALGWTVIGDGSKLDNMVHIGHNCHIGKHVVIAAQTGLSGGVVVEDFAVIGGQVGIGDKARIEARAVIGSGSGILTSKIVRSGSPLWGTPARPLKEHLESLAHLRRLPALKKEVEELRARLADLETRR